MKQYILYLNLPDSYCQIFLPTENNRKYELELSAQLCNFKPGDEVVIPSHTFTASAYPYAKKGAKLVWADVDPVTHVVNAETIEKCITPRTKAIVVVHLYGYVADMPAIHKSSG